MKKRILILSVIILAISTTIILQTRTTSREKFEDRLMQQTAQVELMMEQHGEIPTPGQPEMSAYQDWFQTFDPAEDRVPLERLKTAYNQTLQSQQSSLKSMASGLEWDVVQSNMGGRTRCLMQDPFDADKVWAGAATGGLWYNNNITSQLSQWEPVDEFWAGLAVSSIAFNPLDPDIMYVGTGEAFTAVTIYRESSGLGVGIFKTTDGGDTWTLLPSTEGFKYVTDIEIRNENGTEVIYAGVTSGVYHGTHNSSPSDGLFRSADGGQSWYQVLPMIPGTGNPYAVSDIELGSDGKIYIGTMRNIDNLGGATVLHSSTGIIGSWSVYDDYVNIIENDPDYYIPGRVVLAAAPSDPGVVYILIGAGYQSSSTGFIYSRGRYIARTNDSGQNWAYRPYPSGGDYYWATLAWHALAAAVDPNNADHLYIGGLDVYKTSNGGFDWTQVSDWRGMYNSGPDDYVHADIHDIDFLSNSSEEMIISSDGGVFYTDHATGNSPDFDEVNTNMSTLQFYAADIHPQPGSEKYIGGLQDNGSLYHTGSALNIDDMLSGGDGAYCFIDQDDSEIMITTVYYNVFYLWHYENFEGYWDNWESGIFINPMDYDDLNNQLYANACSFSGSSSNWISRISGWPNNVSGQFINLNTGTDVWFSHVRVSPYSEIGSSTLFLGTLSGRMYKAENAQTNSPEVTELTGNDFPEANLSCIAVGGSEDTLLATFSNYGVVSVWQTLDGGESWTSKEGNLPDMPIRWAMYHPDNANHVMLATETGIWTTDNINATSVVWTADNEGLANVRVDMLQMREADHTVLAATHGRGMATTTWDLTTELADNILPDITLQIYPNPSNGDIYIKTEEHTGLTMVEIFDISGRKVFEREYEQTSSAHIRLNGQPKGEYIVVSHGPKGRGTQKIILY